MTIVAHLGLELRCLGRTPSSVFQHDEIVLADAAVGIEAVTISGSFVEWQRAQFSAKTTLPRVSTPLVGRQVRGAAGRVRETGAASVVFRKNRAMSNVCASVAAKYAEFSPRLRDLDRRDRLAADERVEVLQPLLAEGADVEVDAVERAERADRVGAVLEHARRPHRVRRREERGERPVLQVVVELLVVAARRRPASPCPSAWRAAAAAAGVDRVHRPRVVDVVGRDERGVERAGPRRVEQLEREARIVGRLVEDPIGPEVLRADVRAEVRPLGVVGIGRRLDRIRADVAEAARHARRGTAGRASLSL